MSQEELIQAMVANGLGLARMLKDIPGMEADLNGKVVWYATNIPFPLFNGVLRTNLEPSEADEVIASVLKIYRERNVPMLWSVDPTCTPADLGERLELLGLRYGGSAPGMAIDMTDLTEVSGIPERLSIQTVGSKVELQVWGEIMASCFQLPPFAKEAMCDLMDRMGYGEEKSHRNYLAIYDGEPVGVATLINAGGVAGIYNVGTLPDARRKGIGRELTLNALKDARLGGYRFGVLQSSEMGYNVYAKLGFEEFCQFHRYIWTPD